MADDEKKLVRVSKLLSQRGICSRREADRFIENGWVSINGSPAELGAKAFPEDKIEVHKEAEKQLQEQYTILLNKPIGYVSNLPEKNYKEALELLTLENRDSRDKEHDSLNPQKLKSLAVAGRLDIDSQGLLVFTQNGRIAKKLIGENSEIEKEYLVRVKGLLNDAELQSLQHGMQLDGKALKPAKVEWLNKDQLRFVLTEGKKRQVRRMCEAVGLKVLGLKRVRIGKVMLGHLPEGKWRVLKNNEAF